MAPLVSSRPKTPAYAFAWSKGSNRDEVASSQCLHVCNVNSSIPNRCHDRVTQSFLNIRTDESLGHCVRHLLASACAHKCAEDFRRRIGELRLNEMAQARNTRSTPADVDNQDPFRITDCLAKVLRRRSNAFGEMRLDDALVHPEKIFQSTLIRACWEKKFGSFESGVGNGLQRACELKAEKSSLPAMRNRTVRMVSKRAYPRALRLAA